MEEPQRKPSHVTSSVFSYLSFTFMNSHTYSDNNSQIQVNNYLGEQINI